MAGSPPSPPATPGTREATGGRVLKIFHDARLTLAISVALLVGLLVPVGLVGIIRIGDISDTLWRELTGEHERVVNVLSLGMQDPIWNLLPQTGQPLLDAVVHDPRVTAVTVESTLNGHFLSAEFAERRSDPALLREADVVRNGELIGRVRIEMNVRSLAAQLSLLRNQAIGIAAAQVVLSLVIMMFVLRRKVIRPLRLLVAQSEQLAGNRLDKPFIWRQGDELGDLGRSFEKTRRSLVQLFADLGEGYAAQLESEQRFRAISEAVPVPILITGIDGRRTLFANGYAEQAFGLPGGVPDEQVPVLGFADPRDRARLLEHMRGGGAVVGDEILMRRADGGAFWALLSMQPLNYAGERAVLIACMDISERKAAELTIRESEETLRAILRTATDPIVSVEETGRIIEFNPAAEKTFGYTRAEVMGKEMSAVMVPPHLRAAHTFGMQRYLSGGAPSVLGRRIETEGVRKDGEIFPIELAITEVPFSDRRIFTAYLRDITSRRQTERELADYRENLEELVEIRTAALKSAEDRLVTAINTFQGGFALFDAEELLVIANDRMVDFFPPLGPLRAQPGSRLDAVAAVLADGTGGAADGGREQLARYRAGDAGGEMSLADGRHVEINVSHGSDGSTLFVITDITAHKEATETLHGALEKSRDLALLQRDFVSMASHEFRTPLAIIDAMTQRVIRRHVTLGQEAIVELGTEIRSAVARMVGLIDAILSSSRLDSGEIAFNPQPFDLAAEVREVCKRQQVIAQRHRFELDVDGLPAHVDGDAALIDQALTNLVANAVKYSPEGGRVLVRGWCEDGHARIAVTDEGVGIPAAELPRLFQRFFRARTSTGIAGTGLGLHFVARLMRMHGGAVAVESVEGKGSTFTLTLPFYQTARAEASADHDIVH